MTRFPQILTGFKLEGNMLRAFYAAAFLTLWIFLIQFHFPVTATSPDLSWASALSYFSTRNIQFGKDIIFTFGPLGYVFAPMFTGYAFWGIIIWMLAFKALLAGLGFWVAWRLPNKVLRSAFIGAFLCLPFAEQDVSYIFCIAVLGIGMLHVRHHRLWLAVPVAFILAAFSLIKFTFMVLSLVMLGAVVLSAAMERKFRFACVFGIAYAVALAFWWRLLGQAFIYLPAYIASSLEIVRGYETAMATVGLPEWRLLALAICLPLSTAILIAGKKNLRSWNGMIEALFLLSMLGFAWKVGLTRCDKPHILDLCGFTSVFPFAILTTKSENAPRYKTALGCLSVAVLLSLGFLNFAQEPFQHRYAELPYYWKNAAFGAARNVRELLNWGSLRDRLERALRDQEIAHQLPGVRRMTDDAAVDVLGFSQGIALLNHLNYRPRPTFQSYSAYTPWLLRNNAAFFEKANAPLFVLLRIETIDNRYPTLDDGLALMDVLRRYSPVLVEKSFLLLKRRQVEAPGPWNERPLGRRLGKFGEEIPAPLFRGSPQLAAIRLERSMLGRVLNLFFPEPLVVFRVNAGKEEGKYRLIPNMSRTGFLINPFVKNTCDLLGFFEGRFKGQLLRSFRVDSSRFGKWIYRKQFQVEFYDLPGIWPLHGRFVPASWHRQCLPQP